MHNNQNFSYSKRDALFEDLHKKTFDLLIIGGGITGAGIALDAVSRGLSVALVEKCDFGSGTSSRSTKLIHGGLRYLKQLQFHFVSQLGKEREIIRNNAQHLVIPVPVLLPIYKGGQLKKGLSYMALKLYDVLAGVKKQHRMRWVNKNELVTRYNFIEQKALKGAYLYYEYKTNDGRLVIETLKKANELGAVCLNYTRAISLITDNEQVKGIMVCNELNQVTYEISSRVVINATGVWCKQVLDKFEVPFSKDLYPTKGIHLTFAKDKIPVTEAFYTDTADKRMIFVIPKHNHVYVGTTDTPFLGNYNSPNVDASDINYLLSSLNLRFPGLNLIQSDIVSCWAGVRPLLKSKGSKPGEISRRDELFDHSNGLISITGGKLTGYRLMANKVVNKAQLLLNQKITPTKTATIELSGSNWNTFLSVDKLVEKADAAYDEAKQTGVDVSLFKKLFYRYGTNIYTITEKVYELMPQEPVSEKRWLKAEIWYAVNYEMVVNLSDFLIYRTEMVLFEPAYTELIKAEIADIMAQFLGWSAEEKDMQLLKFDDHWNHYKI